MHKLLKPLLLFTQTATSDTSSHKGNFVPFEQEAKDCRRYAKDFKKTERTMPTPKNKSKPTTVSPTPRNTQNVDGTS